MLGSLNCLPMMNGGGLLFHQENRFLRPEMGWNYRSRDKHGTFLHVTNGWRLRSWGGSRLRAHTNLDRALKVFVFVKVSIITAIIEEMFVSKRQVG